MALLNKLFFPSATATALVPIATSTSSTSSAVTSALTSTTSGSISTTGAPFVTGSNGRSKQRQTSNQTLHSKNYLSQFPFDGSQVRVLVYRECDSRGRRLLFDSGALRKVWLKRNRGNYNKKDKDDPKQTSTQSHGNVNSNKESLSLQQRQQQRQPQISKGQCSAGFIEVCDEYGYEYNRPNSTDISSIGEMVFGALAMSFRGPSLKVHWLQTPARLLCSQVFLSPVGPTNPQSPYSTISTNSLATPRTSISSDQSSIDGLSINSFSLPFSMGQSQTPSDLVVSFSSPLDVPPHDRHSISTNTESSMSSAPRYSSAYSTGTGTDSGYSALSRNKLSSDWSTSYQYSMRSSVGSVTSDRSEYLRKFSIDSSFLRIGGELSELASDGNLQRRISRNLRTSFENENSVNDFIGFIGDNYNTVGSTGGGSEGGSIGGKYRRDNYITNETHSNPEMSRRREGASTKSTSRRAKLGLAVCITMSESFEEEMELFCSEHIALMESMLTRLRANTERAYINHKDFLRIMYQTWQEIQQWFSDLFTAPRIKCPVWLSITTSGSKYSKNVAERFVKELCWLLSFADTKDTNFFVSTMLTAILTHHLGWVSTVSPFHSSGSKTGTSRAAIEQRAKLQQVSQRHPYNALWAQLGDLFGAIGLPPKLARTVIYGTEKLSVERLLNVLTYFIRCGEVRRSAKFEDFNKDLVNRIVMQQQNECIKKSSLFGVSQSAGLRRFPNSDGGGLIRTQSCKQNLNTILDAYETKAETGTNRKVVDEVELVKNQKKNEIPNVLAFRDSRFVQQELRIGNYLMDTGIEKKSLKEYQAKQNVMHGGKDGRIRLTLTTPDNVEMCVVDRRNSDDGVMEAIEIEGAQPIRTEVELSAAGKKAKVGGSKKSFWSMVPSSVKEGLSVNDVQKMQHSGRNANLEDVPTLSANSTQSTQSTQHLSLSDLITQNSMGKSDRMTWGIEPIKENVSLEEQIHFDLCQKLIERDHGISRTNQNSNNVVFVLGENEPLVNLKRSTEDLAEEQLTQLHEQKPSGDSENTGDAAPEQLLCPIHQHMHTSAVQLKKHSGVKFNFEQYPQIVTNYMKSKNLVMSNYELLMNKCEKLEAATMAVSMMEPSSTFSANKQEDSKTCASGSCIICNGILNSYQTPSNATELEFETDEIHSFPASVSGTRPLTTVSSATSVETLISTSQVNEESKTTTKTEDLKVKRTATSPSAAHAFKEKSKETQNKTCIDRSKQSLSQLDSVASVAEKIHLLKLPIPGIKELPQGNGFSGDMKLPAGFIPSLFLNVSDHYISDMVLQGTFASPTKWEMSLREDLALAARSTSLVSLPAENVAIVADMEKWDVKLFSSQSQCFPYGDGQSAPVGMSQLVSSMLETVQAMNSAGISAYECLSFLESKLQEIYMNSETLAAFLLETDFCSLSDVTTALNLTENDVPLLLSVASIHTPQISKKCGISFR